MRRGLIIGGVLAALLLAAPITLVDARTVPRATDLAVAKHKPKPAAKKPAGKKPTSKVHLLITKSRLGASVRIHTRAPAHIVLRCSLSHRVGHTWTEAVYELCARTVVYVNLRSGRYRFIVFGGGAVSELRFTVTGSAPLPKPKLHTYGPAGRTA